MAIDPRWATLLRSTIDSAHPGFFPGFSPLLIEHARDTPLGRRMLALRLQRTAPLLFQLSPANDSAWIDHQPAALFSGERLRGAAYDLGALAFAPGLRAHVERREVLLLREAIGAARMSFALTTDAWHGAVPEAVRQYAQAGLSRVIDNPSAVRELLRRRGRVELLAYAHHLHSMLGERIRIAFAPAAAGENLDAWLPGEFVAAYLSAASESATEVRA